MTQPTLNDLRKRQIIDAAITVFGQKGFHQARMLDISEAAGVSKGTPYRYFKDKNALITAVANKVFDQELGELDMVRHLQGTAVEKLRIMAHFFAAGSEEAEAYAPLIYEFYAMSVRRADVRQILSEYLHISIKIVQDILRQGVEQGEFPAIDVEKTAVTYMALLEGTVAQELYNPTVNVSEQLQFGINLLLKGL